MRTLATTKGRVVHCHIGSLEISAGIYVLPYKVHCHIGSLEKERNNDTCTSWVHCHIGSLEMD